MSRPTYTPTEEEIERIREHVAMNSPYQETGQRKAGRDRKKCLYPKGLTSYAEQAGVEYRQFRRILSGSSNTTPETWKRIMSVYHVNSDESQDELREALRRLRYNIQTIEALLPN